MRDIETRDDIKIMVDSFYEKAKIDSLIAEFFEDLDWDEHLPRIYSFWSNLLLNDGSYKGNPMIPHVKLARKKMLEKEHFERWVKIFQLNVDELFSGTIADMAKLRAGGIAQIMPFKIKQLLK